MNVRPLFIFRTPFYEPRYQEFYSTARLREFLTEFNFLAPHIPSVAPSGLAEFQLGARMEFFIDGYACSSDVRWGPRFVVGRRVKFDGKRMFIETPLDTSVCDNLVLRQYCEIPFHRGMADAVINLDGLRQLWPVCENSRSELIKFLTRTAREQYTIKRR